MDIHGRERSIRALVDVSVVVGILTGVLTTGSVLRMARVRAMVVVFVLPATDLSLDVLQRILQRFNIITPMLPTLC